MNLEDLLVEDYPELSDTPPPEAKRGVVGEVVTGLKRGATVHLPAMIGQVGKWFSEPGALMYEAGESLNTEAQIRGSHPDRQLQPEAHGMVTNSLAGGAEMLVPSVGPQVVAVLGDVLFPPAAPYFHGMAAAGTGTLYGASQAQDTYERVLEATGDKSKAQMAGLASGTIEAGGEALASYIGGKYLTGALKFLGPKNGVKVAERVLAKARNPKALAAFGTSTVMNAATEVGTEMGQNAGEIAVERAAGVQEGPTPWEAAKEAVSPTLGMSALMLPLGGVGSYRANRQTQKMLTWLEDAEVPVEKRSQAAAFFHNEIAQQDQEAADQWAAATLTAIGEGRPLQVMDSGETKAGPLSKAVEKIAPQQVVAEPVDAVPVEQETGAAERSGYAIPLPDEEPMSEAEDWNARFDEGLARSIEGEDVEEGIDDLSGMRQEVGGPAPEVPAVRGAAVEPAVAEEFARVDDEQGSLPTPMDAQAHEAASSPANDSMEPTPAQIEAGNYKKGHLRLHGLDISIENPAGSVRKGTDETGRAWEQELSHHYGYIKGTVGPDKDHIDVFIKPGIDQSTAGDAVFVVDQKNLKNGRFDEPKVMVGYGSEEEARQAYLANYDGSGPKRIMDVTPTSVEDFRAWLQKGDTKKAFAGQAEKAKVREEPAEAVAEPLTKPIKLNFMVLQRQARQGELKISKKQADGSYSITGLADGVVKHRAENLAGVYAYLNGESDGAAQRQEEVQPPAVEGTPAEIDSRLDRQPTFDKKTQPGAVGAASTLDAELADLDTDDLSAMFDEVVQERRDEPAGTTLLEAQNMLIGLRTQVEKQGRVVDDRLLESEEEQSKVEDNPDEWRKEYRRKYADEGGHFASGYADFNKGLPRKLPPCYIVRKGKNPGNWFRGWDAANQDKTGVKSQVKPETRPATQKPVPSAAQSASKIAAEAAKHGVKGVDEAMKGLVDLFGGADSLKSFPSGLSRDTYEQAKPHFQKALQEFRTAGKGVKDFMRFIVENFSAKVKPYLMYFLEEVKSGDIVNSREVETEKENTDDRIEGTGCPPSAVPASCFRSSVCSLGLGCTSSDFTISPFGTVSTFACFSRVSIDASLSMPALSKPG